jgi:tight adherence protein C
VILAVVGGLAASIGLIGLVGATRAPRHRLAEVLAVTDREPPRRSADGGIDGRLARNRWRADLVLGSRIASSRDVARFSERLAPDLALTSTRLEDLCAQGLVGALVGATLPVACWALVEGGGVRASRALPVWASLLLAAMGAALPFVVLLVEARRARADARRVVGSFLDLVVLCLAGGMGIESALHASARIGQHDLSRRLADALSVARDAGEAPWAALEALGRRIGVDELVELAAALSLAGREGARVRATLAAKASALRKRELAAAEAEANRLTERLFVPGIFLLVGFLVFIGYPAVVRILTGL